MIQSHPVGCWFRWSLQQSKHITINIHRFFPNFITLTIFIRLKLESKNDCHHRPTKSVRSATFKLRFSPGIVFFYEIILQENKFLYYFLSEMVLLQILYGRVNSRNLFNMREIPFGKPVFEFGHLLSYVVRACDRAFPPAPNSQTKKPRHLLPNLVRCFSFRL